MSEDKTSKAFCSRARSRPAVEGKPCLIDELFIFPMTENQLSHEQGKGT